MTTYHPLWMVIEGDGWRCKALPVEMGCSWYVSRALIVYLCRIGLSAPELRKTTKNLSQLRIGFGRHYESRPQN